MFKLGLTGNICAGKSEVERILAQLGYEVIDLDKITHDLFENNKDVQAAILKEFNTLDRKKIAAVVFSDNSRKKTLENIIHPELKKYILNLFKNPSKNVVVSGALLYEAGFDKLFDKIIYVNASYDVRLKRLIKRNNLDEISARKRLDCQEDNSEKADFVVENNGEIEELKEKAGEIVKKFS